MVAHSKHILHIIKITLPYVWLLFYGLISRSFVGSMYYPNRFLFRTLVYCSRSPCSHCFSPLGYRHKRGKQGIAWTSTTCSHQEGMLEIMHICFVTYYRYTYWFYINTYTIQRCSLKMSCISVAELSACNAPPRYSLCWTTWSSKYMIFITNLGPG